MLNPHEQERYREEGRQQARFEAAKQRKLEEITKQLGELIVTALAMMPYDEWPPVAKAALRHIAMNDPRTVFEYKKLLNQDQPG